MISEFFIELINSLEILTIFQNFLLQYSYPLFVDVADAYYKMQLYDLLLRSSI